MKAVIIDYGGGNVHSVLNAFTAIDDSKEIIISKNLSEIVSATHLILPGVGAFGDCMSGLKAVDGLIATLQEQVLVKKKSFLGICVGMQVLATVGNENGAHQGLGFIDGKVEKLTPKNLKIPHMGWNELLIKNKNHPIFSGIKFGEHFYFANSYHFICDDENYVAAHVEYGSSLAAVVTKNNIFGVQFHPEKSGAAGLKLLRNFIQL